MTGLSSTVRSFAFALLTAAPALGVLPAQAGQHPSHMVIDDVTIDDETGKMVVPIVREGPSLPEGHASIASTLFPSVTAGGSKVDQAYDSSDGSAGRRPLRAFLACPNPDEAIVGVFGAIDTVKIRRLGAWCVKISPHPPEPGGTGVLPDAGWAGELVVALRQTEWGAKVGTTSSFTTTSAPGGGAPVDQPAGAWGGAYGSAGGTPFVRICPRDHVLTALDGRAGNDLNRLQVICSPIHEELHGLGIDLYGNKVVMSSVGSSSGSDFSAIGCPGQMMAKGIALRFRHVQSPASEPYANLTAPTKVQLQCGAIDAATPLLISGKISRGRMFQACVEYSRPGWERGTHAGVHLALGGGAASRWTADADTTDTACLSATGSTVTSDTVPLAVSTVTESSSHLWVSTAWVHEVVEFGETATWGAWPEVVSGTPGEVPPAE